MGVPDYQAPGWLHLSRSRVTPSPVFGALCTMRNGARESHHQIDLKYGFIHFSSQRGCETRVCETHTVSDVWESESEKRKACIHKITGVWDTQLRLHPIYFRGQGRDLRHRWKKGDDSDLNTRAKNRPAAVYAVEPTAPRTHLVDFIYRLQPTTYWPRH